MRVFLSALDDFEFIWSPLYSLEKREGESEDPFLPIFVCSAVAIRRRRNENWKSEVAGPKSAIKEIGLRRVALYFHGSRVSHPQKWDFSLKSKDIFCRTPSTCAHEENPRLSPSQLIFGKEIATGRLEPFILDLLALSFRSPYVWEVCSYCLVSHLFFVWGKKRFNLQGIKDMVPHGVQLYMLCIIYYWKFFCLSYGQKSLMWRGRKTTANKTASTDLISCREAFRSTREKSDESHQFCVVLSCFCRKRRSGNFRSSHRIKNNVKVYAQLSVSPLRHLRVLCGAIMGKCYEATLAKGKATPK